MTSDINMSNNTEIEQALKEFEAKDEVKQTQEKIEEKKSSNIPKIVQLTMKFFGVEQKQAEYILSGFAIIVVFFSLYLAFFGTSKSKMLSPETIKKLEEYKIPESYLQQ